jgi:hypothetical protein
VQRLSRYAAQGRSDRARPAALTRTHTPPTSSFFIYSFLTNHAVAKKGLPSRPRRQSSALLTGTSQFQVNNQSTSRVLTPVRPLPQQNPCLTSLRLLPETSHSDAFACRNARQQTVKGDERETLLSLFASRRAKTNVPARHHPNPTATILPTPALTQASHPSNFTLPSCHHCQTPKSSAYRGLTSTVTLFSSTSNNSGLISSI